MEGHFRNEIFTDKVIDGRSTAMFDVLHIHLLDSLWPVGGSFNDREGNFIRFWVRGTRGFSLVIDAFL